LHVPPFLTVAAMQRHFTFHPSNYLTLIIVVAHAVVMAALLFVPIPKVALVALLMVLAASAAYYALRDARLGLESSWVALRLENDRVVLVNRKGEEWTGALLRGSVVTAQLAVLNVLIQDPRRRCNVVLMPDSMGAESFRQLRVALKWRAVPIV
jgi:toxin CptA